MAAKRLRKELDDMAQSPEQCCTAGPVGDDFFVWQASLTGPPDSPYAGGRFLLELCFPPNYPHSPPKVRFATRIFHPNVQWGSGKGEGSVCIDVLHSGLWRPECTVRHSKESNGK